MVWVAITRARRFVGLIYIPPVPLLDRPEFANYAAEWVGLSVPIEEDDFPLE